MQIEIRYLAIWYLNMTWFAFQYGNMHVYFTSVCKWIRTNRWIVFVLNAQLLCTRIRPAEYYEIWVMVKSPIINDFSHVHAWSAGTETNNVIKSKQEKNVVFGVSEKLWLVGWFCCFTSQVNSYGHCETVSSPNHTFSWAGLNKRVTSNSCTYFRL